MKRAALTTTTASKNRKRKTAKVRRRGRTEDLTDQRFGHLTIVKRAESDDFGTPMWHARCSCGGMTTVRSNHLKAGATLTCGATVPAAHDEIVRLRELVTSLGGDPTTGWVPLQTMGQARDKRRALLRRANKTTS
jgi:hypothetical protein